MEDTWAAITFEDLIKISHDQKKQGVDEMLYEYSENQMDRLLGSVECLENVTLTLDKKSVNIVAEDMGLDAEILYDNLKLIKEE